MIKLDLIDIRHADRIDKETLQKVERELSLEDIQFYEDFGWNDYNPKDFIDYLLPELGPSIYLKRIGNPVVEIFGRRYRLTFNFDCNSEPYEAADKSVIFEETDAPLSKSDVLPANNRRCFELKLFGQPIWVQNPHYISYKGKPCYHLASIENNWGDSGNQNVLIGCSEEGIPEIGYFEASCC